MKLGPDVDHLNTFRLPNLSVSLSGGAREHIQRNTKKCDEIYNISTLTCSNNILQNAMKVGIF